MDEEARIWPGTDIEAFPEGVKTLRNFKLEEATLILQGEDVDNGAVGPLNIRPLIVQSAPTLTTLTLGFDNWCERKVNTETPSLGGVRLDKLR